MNERGKNILPVIGFILIIAVLLGGFATAKAFTGKKAATNKNTSKSGLLGGYTIDDSGNIPTDGIDKITISAVSSEINIQTQNSDSVEAHFYGNVTTLNKDSLPHLQVVREGNTAVVKIEYPKVINGSISGSTKLDVKIPKGWEEDLEVGSISGRISAPELTGDSIRVGTTSGEIQSDSITGNEVSLNSTSGSFKIGKMIARENFSKSSISGRCEIDTLECDEAELESTSAETVIRDASAKAVTSNSISGSTEIDMKNGSAQIATTSGSIVVRFEEGFENFKANSVSGSVKLEIPGDSEFKVRIDTVSGDINCNDFSMKITSAKRNRLEGEVGNGDSDIEISTTSGGVQINKR